MPGVAKLPDPTSRIPKSSYDREPQDTNHFTHASSSANTPILQKDSEVSLFETEIEIEMKIFLQNIIEIQSKLNLKKRNRNTNIKSEMDCIKLCNVTLS
jgi:hypothetical protein